jgi:hypothetical protein
MNQTDSAKKKPPLALWFLIISIVFTLLCATGIGVFIKLNQTIKMTSGKIVETFTKKEFATRKQAVDRQYEVVRYTVAGKDYTGKTALPKTGYSSQYVTVYYYENYPGFAWFFKKTNSGLFFCSLLAALFGAGVVLSAFRLIKKPIVAAAPAGIRQQTKMTAKPAGKKTA